MSTADYRSLRIPKNAARRFVWRSIANYLKSEIDADSPAVDLGAGNFDFLENVRSTRKIAIDLDPAILDDLIEGVEALHSNVAESIPLPTDLAGTVLASNLLEHLERDEIDRCLREIYRTLRPGGKLLVIQPNFRINPHHYFDDFTHKTILTHHSLRDWLLSIGFEVTRIDARFLPLTLKSRLSFGHRLTPLYLRLPYRPFASQMLVIARKPTGIRHEG